VLTAADGRQALDLLERTAARVVVSDLVMPVMNGWELAEALRERPGLSHLPVLFVTAVSNVGRAPRGAVFLKPLHLESLLRAVKLHMGRAAD
jgi:CheY-like chemotaxis protein